MSRLIIVGCGPGRSGADTLIRVLGCHPEVSGGPPLPPALISAAVEMLQFGAADSDSYLPRRAAQAYGALHGRLAAFGLEGRRAADRLRRVCAATDIYVPAYGDLLLPGPHPASWWASLLRAALIGAGGNGQGATVVAKIGGSMSAAAGSLLVDDDVFAFVVRHPATLLDLLTASTIDGMAPDEAQLYLMHSLGHTRSLLGQMRARVLTIRLEDLCSTPHTVLATIAAAAGLAGQETDLSRWAERVARVLPEDVRRPCAHAGQLDPMLRQLAEEWGY